MRSDREGHAVCSPQHHSPALSLPNSHCRCAFSIRSKLNRSLLSHGRFESKFSLLWLRHLRSNLPPLLRVVSLSLNGGDLRFISDHRHLRSSTSPVIYGHLFFWSSLAICFSNHLKSDFPPLLRAISLSRSMGGLGFILCRRVIESSKSMVVYSSSSSMVVYSSGLSLIPILIRRLLSLLWWCLIFSCKTLSSVMGNEDCAGNIDAVVSLLRCDSVWYGMVFFFQIWYISLLLVEVQAATCIYCSFVIFLF
jgi:hypothetical protein